MLIFGHNLLDGIVMEGTSFTSIIWYLLHQDQLLVINPNLLVLLHYPLIPWIGLMAVGYCFGTLYTIDFEVAIRKKCLVILGLSSIVLFFSIRGINIYGDLVPWSIQKNTTYTILSFFNFTKYPPSLDYVLITIGPTLLVLFFLEKIKNKITDFLLVFGRVPFFFYFLHVFVIHIVAIIGIFLFGGNWRDMILDAKSFINENLATYGYSLVVVYIVWFGLILFFYPFCKKYMLYKANNRDKWWLSYL